MAADDMEHRGQRCLSILGILALRTLFYECVGAADDSASVEVTGTKSYVNRSGFPRNWKVVLRYINLAFDVFAQSDSQ